MFLKKDKKKKNSNKHVNSCILKELVKGFEKVEGVKVEILSHIREKIYKSNFYFKIKNSYYQKPLIDIFIDRVWHRRSSGETKKISLSLYVSGYFVPENLRIGPILGSTFIFTTKINK